MIPWIAVLNRHCTPIIGRPTSAITEAEVLSILAGPQASPTKLTFSANALSTTNNPTARRVIDRLNLVISHARGLVPARFAQSADPCSRLYKLLPRGMRPETIPMRALQWRDLPAFYSAAKQHHSVLSHAPWHPSY
jgi:hypothetical protein